MARSYSERIHALATSHGLPMVRWSDFKRDPVGYLQQEAIEGLLCIGWRYLIPEAAIAYLCGNVVAAHDSLLPKFRGFAPLPTALIVGEKRAGVTFLRVGRGVDEGDILWQKAMDIGPTDTIAQLIERVVPLYREGATMFLNGELSAGVPQDSSQATYSIWRDERDYWIDWHADSAMIERTVRALGDPYLGARCRLNDKIVIVHQAEIVPDIGFALRQPGKVWGLDERGCPTVVCGQGMLRILAATCQGASILPMQSLRVRFG
ncbi:MAG: methionyl-tRNA formyltransferase [Pirellulaceae bacterium]